MSCPTHTCFKDTRLVVVMRRQRSPFGSDFGEGPLARLGSEQ